MSNYAFFTERSYFTGKVDELGVGIKPETEKYSYQIVVLDTKKAVQTIGVAKKDGLMSYTGLVYIKALGNSEDIYIEALLCSSKKPTKVKPPRFKLSPQPTCPDGYE
ncbi:type IV pilin-like G/H family protein [Tumidithrix elongata RA019]|uniref:Type IV pilin-like G/H family protein n=1 Tax=Tumidithrix elongata BACA0141 TaxID=2716417 RepID=A0AAW9Q5P3_9CYAN|nr:type IV pilin-like G/H family protein [Tumidithrix elongata RA019]